MSAQYDYTEVLDQVADPDSTKYSSIGSAIVTRNIVNRAVRLVLIDVDLRSTKRRSQIAPFIFDEVYDYTCPTDLKGDALIDILPQINRTEGSQLNLVDEAFFDRKKTARSNLVAVADDDMVRKLKLNIDADDTVLTLAHLDTLTEDGTWATFSAGSTNVVADTSNFQEGSGSIKFDLASGTTTAGIVNSTFTAVDISDYTASGSVFVWAYINSATNLTNFILRLGSDNSNYYTQTITTNNEGVAFYQGWNLLRFDFASMTQTGTVVPTAADYCAVYMTKTSGKNDAGYRFDYITLHTGTIYQALYYSKYGWQDNTGAWIENSTADTDLLNADTDELDLIALKGKEQIWLELEEWDQYKQAQTQYQLALRAYKKNNRSQRLKRRNFYWSN